MQALLAENAMYKEWSGKSIAEMELLSNKAVVLEVPICQSCTFLISGALLV